MSTGQRVLLRTISALVGLVLLGLAGLGIGEIVSWLTGGGEFLLPTASWYAALRSTPWKAMEVVYAGIALLIVGLLLLLVAGLSRPRLFALTKPTEEIDVVIPPRAVAQMLRRQAEAVSGVASASVEVTKDVARVNATAPLASPDRVQRDLEEAITHALKQIPWSRMPRIDLEIVGNGPAAAEVSRPASVTADQGGDAA
ncbi:DUF6286 domain-containing protein [Blastococcus sp. Marseille-P5729]|uniref:DUF6286 domain-containing protein n=1 Tax=Blastococcus sp. Marseille-P5729 TaxID=2086582 RepID=UPI000D10EFD5|nr:DUF6286 domain-containing protein [Blastococcus sp. Marseille-P5729]